MLFFCLAVGVLMLATSLSCNMLATETRDCNPLYPRNEGFVVLWITLIACAVELSLCLAFGLFTLERAYGWVVGNLYHLPLVIAGYFACGVLYSFLWMPGFVRDRLTRLRRFRADYEANYKEGAAGFKSWVGDRGFYGIGTDREVPEFFEYRALLGRRIAWWPFYAIAWIFIDLLVNLGRWISRLGSWVASLFRSIYDRIAEAAVASMTRESRPEKS